MGRWLAACRRKHGGGSRRGVAAETSRWRRCDAAHAGWTLHAVTAALAVFAHSSPTWACSGQLSGALTAEAAYAPFQALDTSKEMQLSVQNTGDAECVFWLGVERLATTDETATLNFELRGHDGTWSSSGAATLSGPAWLASRRLAANERYDIPLTLAIPAGQVLPPGEFIYSFDVTLSAAPDARAPQGAEPLQSRALRLSIAIAAQLSINIAGAGVRKTVDFGELATGGQKQVRIETRSNQRYQLDVLSRNGGVLAMAPPYETWRVPYALVLDGRPVQLPGTVGPFAGTGLAGSQFDMEFTIGDVLNKRAGLYRDEVTIEIKPAI